MNLRQAAILAAALTATLILAACGGGNSDSSSQSPPLYSFDYVPTGVTANALFTWDIAWIDSPNELYVQCDRTTKGVDVFDIKANAFKGTITGGFTGPVLNTSGAVNNTKSGPNGCTLITGTSLVYAGDVNKVIVVDDKAMTVVTSVANDNAALGGTGLRSDEGCYDADDKIYLIATPDVDNSVAGHSAFLTVMDATNPSAPTIKGYISFFDPTDPTGLKAGTASAGLEQCAYDAVNKQFLVNNDGTVANPDGEVDAFSAAAVKAIAGGATVNETTLAGYKVFGVGGTTVQCNPRGLDLGPGTTAANAEFAINCSNPVGKPMVTQIMNRSTGAIIATAKFGGGDQLMYDPSTNAYYVTGSNWNSTGIRASSTSPVNPMIGVVAATTGTVTAQLQAGQGSHAVAVDPVSHEMFVPHTMATSICPSCIGPFAISGVSVYRVQ